MAISVRGQDFVDRQSGRTVHLRGINVSGDSKLPSSPDVPSHRGADGVFWDADNVSFVGRPFPLSEADFHFSKLASWGFNTIRFIVTWEAIEHAGPGTYDEDFIVYVIACLRKCGDHGLYAIIDPHQDVWSRYSGGSGAPYWTLAAAGLDPHAFTVTDAAKVHNTDPDPQNYPKMIWSTNYERAAVATMFTLFWAGQHFAPNCILNGVNIQEYLQSHYIDCMAHLARRIHDAGGLEDEIVVGWESLNEPAPALIGHPDLTRIPKEQKLRKGTCPTMEQAFLLAAGVAQTVDVWDFGKMGPHKTGTRAIDPRGQSIWAQGSRDDAKYGFKRDPRWDTSRCIWQQHGVHDGRRVLQPQYFHADHDGQVYDNAKFLDDFWMPHFRRYKAAIRAHHADAILFCQPPVLKIPPVFNAVDRQDSQIVYAPHFYDGLTLVTKHWNTWYNVDVLGVLRGRYLSEVLAVKFGIRAIRNCLRDQLRAMRKEGLDNMGEYPCFFTEIGIPFDMDEKAAYRDGDYGAQVAALDANGYALEGAGAHYTWWQYSSLNTHKWGDFWNGEDLSFWSNSGIDPATPSPPTTASTVGSEVKASARSSTTLSSPTTQTADATRKSSGVRMGCHFPARSDTIAGTRAHQAFLRPSPILVSGRVVEYGFDLKKRIFTLTLDAARDGGGDAVTECFLPSLHFAALVKWDVDGTAQAPGVTLDIARQLLTWRHSPSGRHTLVVYGVEQGGDGTMKVVADEEGWRLC